jgi:predicted nucleic acid-binding protein
MRAEHLKLVIDSNVWISAAKAPFLVSGDQDLLSVVQPAGLTILSPADALVWIKFTL